MKLVMARSIGYETAIPLIPGLLHSYEGSVSLVFWSPEFPDHISEGEDRSEDQFRVIFSAQRFGLRVAIRKSIGLGAFGDWAGNPFLFVDAFR